MFPSLIVIMKDFT